MNPLLNEKYQKLRDLILAREGKTIEDELEFGCHVYFCRLDEDHGWFSKEEGVGVITHTSPKKRSLYLLNKFHIDRDYKGWEQNTKSISCPLDFTERYEILGQPISLERVLRALDFFRLGFFCATSSGRIYCDHDDYRTNKEICKWSLGQLLHLQSEEVWDGLINILIQGK